MTKKSFERLPRSIVPQHYKVTLKTDFPNSLCTGSVDISLEVSEPANIIRLDALDLSVKSCALKLANGDSWEPTELRMIPNDERLELTFANSVPTGPCTLSISFSGAISTNLRGFYKTKPKADAGGACEEHGVTQFAATEARRCFPCWDEPSFKATFELIFITPSNLETLSNMEIEEITDLGQGWKKVGYPKTPKMSSYLVAFAIGNYDFVECTTKSNVRVRVYTPKGMKACGNFSVDFAVKSLEFYEDYFSIPYPLTKLDLLAVADFAYGAMENWGLVVFRQPLLLFDELQSDSSRRQSVSMTVAHEIAHQWFGNLVTMEWWTHLWLNEGFASFMEHICTHTLNPEFGLRSQFSLTLNGALQLDALDSSHPIEVPINHPSETDEIFDKISYNKGASIISMLYHHIGDKKFREGMTKYLNKHEYGNAQTEDLWRALQTPTDPSIVDLMEPWTSQMGFPQLTVKCVDGELHISQEKFYSNSESALKVVTKPKWKVPISIATNKTATPIKIVLDDFTGKVPLPGGTTWVHVNSGGTGVFRVLYEESMFINLLSALKEKALVNDKDRYAIHADLAAQVAANYRSSSQLLQLTSALEDDESYIVWHSITGALKELAAVYQNDRELHERISGFARKLYSKIFASLGWEKSPNDDHCRCLLRVLVIDALIAFDDKDVVAEASRKLRESLAGKYTLPVDLKFAAFKGFAKSGEDSVWDTLWNIFRSAKLQDDELKALRALGCANQEDIILRLLEANLSDEIRSQDGPFVVRELAGSPMGQTMLWTHYTKHHERYMERFNTSVLLPTFINALTSNFDSVEMADEVQAFFEKNPVAGTERSLLQSRERILRRASWRQRDRDCLMNFFKS